MKRLLLLILIVLLLSSCASVHHEYIENLGEEVVSSVLDYSSVDILLTGNEEENHIDVEIFSSQNKPFTSCYLQNEKGQKYTFLLFSFREGDVYTGGNWWIGNEYKYVANSIVGKSDYAPLYSFLSSGEIDIIYSKDGKVWGKEMTESTKKEMIDILCYMGKF